MKKKLKKAARAKRPAAKTRSKARPARAPKPARKSASRPAPKFVVVGGSVRADFPRDPAGPEAVYGAAYLMTDRAYAQLEPLAGGALRVSLTPKAARGAAALEDLRRAFQAEWESQVVRWAVARGNRSIREYVVENAVSLAQGRAAPAAAAAPAAPEELTAEQRTEIEKLIAEVEAEIKEMNASKSLPDPAGATKSWEAAQDAAGGEKTK